MPLLGYGRKWQNFYTVLEKAITACHGNKISVDNHFTDAGKMASLGSGSQRKLKDYHLSRFACYLIAQNGDSRKPEIAAAQAYFAISTRENELQKLFKEQQERLPTRLKVAESYKSLGEAASVAGVDSAFFGIFIGAGYLGLHRHTRAELMQIKDIPEDEEYRMRECNIFSAPINIRIIGKVQEKERRPTEQVPIVLCVASLHTKGHRKKGYVLDVGHDRACVGRCDQRGVAAQPATLDWLSG